MAIVAVILSLLVAALGAFGIVAPGRLVAVGRLANLWRWGLLARRIGPVRYRVTVKGRRRLDWLRAVLTPAGLYVAAAFRLVLGLVLFVAAPDSRAPGALRILGVIIIVHGLATPFVGLERSRKLLDIRWTRRGNWFMRLWGGVACGFGLWLAYTVAG